MVPVVIIRWTCTGRVWPIRWARSLACSSTAGFHQRSKWTTWSARVRLRPVPPAFSDSRKTGHPPRRPGRTPPSRSRSATGVPPWSSWWGTPCRARWSASSRAIATYWVKTRTAPSSASTVPTISSSRSIFSERPAQRPLLEEVGGVVADLLEAGEHRQHQAAALRLVGPLDPLQAVAHVRLVEHDLLAGQRQQVVGVGPGRQLGGDAGVGLAAAQQERRDQLAEPGGHRRVDARLDRRRPVPGGRRCGCRAGPGVAQSRIDHSSVSSFSTGVPVSATRAADGIVRSSRAVAERGFLTCWASSATTRSHATPASVAASTPHRAVGGEHERRAGRRAPARSRRQPWKRRTGTPGGEPLDLRLPVAEQRGGADDEGRAGAAAAAGRCRASAIRVTVLPRPMSSARQAPSPSEVSWSSQVRPWRW